jgi:CRISPR/Cas system CMR subunit Cmr6 (Cas7 group RAMP superfamily)
MMSPHYQAQQTKTSQPDNRQSPELLVKHITVTVGVSARDRQQSKGDT